VKFGILVFPGTWSDRDCYHAIVDVAGGEAGYVWHKETDLSGYDCLIVPGGFSYGDYLRAGAIARFSPVMGAVTEFAERGGLVLGICNGFQILCEAGLLPGALMRNSVLQFRCQWVNLRIENARTPFTNAFEAGQVVRVPISHGEGNYFAPPEVIADLEANNQIVVRYCDDEGNLTAEANPNGSVGNIAGIINRAGNVLGMMPHPERCVEPLLGGTDGRYFFESIMRAYVRQ
jgi:phosphoribosylformylglycinamidine synthase I